MFDFFIKISFSEDSTSRSGWSTGPINLRRPIDIRIREILIMGEIVTCFTRKRPENNRQQDKIKQEI